ncbi:hypothetical protein KPL28_03575 [Clostridium algidicarnis]|uniref:hypothetical protein n=1 Tax=Clostridium algidicarnis TaxID=37659 RepID=UPI001C0AA7F1|nr:hypothetical protein [Clostridium algidicarnis]MBU3208717.1 hypothetical protein [Clostridium algidicarnis]
MLSQGSKVINTRKLKQAHKSLLRREGFVPCKFLLIKQTSQDVEFVEIKTKKLLTIRI